MSNLSLLVHTFDDYKRFWPGCFAAWNEHINQYLPNYFGTDIETDIETRFKVIYSGQGEWSDRLKKLLAQISTEYVLYAQEDHWPKAAPPNFSQMMAFVKKYDLLRLQLAPVNQYYTLTGSELPLFFHKSSKYLVSHQPSIWKKSFLLDCLGENESPWMNEYEGTKRINHKARIINKIAIYPCDWFAHKCVKGKEVA